MNLKTSHGNCDAFNQRSDPIPHEVSVIQFVFIKLHPDALPVNLSSILSIHCRNGKIKVDCANLNHRITIVTYSDNMILMSLNIQPASVSLMSVCVNIT